MRNFKKVSIVSAILIGFLTAILTITTFAYGATKTIFNSDTGLTFQEFREILNIKKIIEEMYYEDVSDIDFVEGVKKGIVESVGDPYTRYMNIEEYNQDLEDTTGSFEGIGVYISPAKDGTILVIAPIKNSPADIAGIKPGDKILKINGENYDASTLQDAVKVMKGKKGTSVEIELLDAQTKNIKTLNVTRDKIETESVVSEMIDDIGYIGIISFDEDTANEFRENYKEIEKNNPKGLIIDLRSNPGGIFDQVLDISNQILPKSVIVYTNNVRNEKQVFKADDKEEINLPIVVLVDKNSASASEILAGALQDNKKAKIVGETTFGKGLVQAFFKINDKDAISITTAQYYTPNGNVVNGVGIIPDYEVESSKNTKEKDFQLEKAIEILK